ncbi:MAG TPA: cation:proton antiporter [Streptosporangiaceae bacterium]|nr:cation:proton antiporter [Streptosporangiaceae bacterium]
MSAWAGVAVAGTLGVYALVSARLSKTIVSGPMLFVAAGLALGPLGLGLLTLGEDAEPVRILFEVTLALVLFTDALSVQSKALRRDDFLPIRLLAVGLPLTIALGWLFAWLLLPGLNIWEMALLGTVLAPTDAALGQSAISNPGVPQVVRQGLNVESGLNDGMSLPFFVLFLAAAAGHESAQGPGEAFFRALVLSAVLGAAVGWGAAAALRWSAARGWVEEQWRHILVITAAMAAYELAVVVEGSGFIAAWVAGLIFGTVLRSATDTPRPAAAAPQLDLRHTAGLAEDLGGLLAAVSFVAFGAVLLGPALQHLSWRAVVYAVASLTVIRMLPVVAALVRSGLRWPTVAYIGWFGPRGLASIVLGLITLEEHIPGVATVSAVIAVTVGISVYAHGATSVPLAARYAAWWSGMSASMPGREGAAVRNRDKRPRLGFRGSPTALPPVSGEP